MAEWASRSVLQSIRSGTVIYIILCELRFVLLHLAPELIARMCEGLHISGDAAVEVNRRNKLDDQDVTVEYQTVCLYTALRMLNRLLKY